MVMHPPSGLHETMLLVMFLICWCAASAAAGGLPILLVAGAVIVAGVIAVTVFASFYNNSGRGLDTDEWEVDHSIWMDQLQKDFESSWSQE